MSLELLEDVYNLDRNYTSCTEQAILAALAYRANNKTRLCFPKQETLADMTHLSRATIQNALNALRKRGIIDWIQGGLNKRGKYGQTLANSYKLNIPKAPKQSRKSKSLAPDLAPQSPKPVINPSYENTQSQRKTLLADFDAAMNSFGINANKAIAVNSLVPEKRPTADELLKKTLEVCEISEEMDSYTANYRSFQILLMNLDFNKAVDEIMAFESEKKQGEMKKIKNYAAALTERLKKLRIN